MPTTVKKFHLTKILPKKDPDSIVNFRIATIDEIYDKISTMYFGRNVKIVQSLSNLKFQNSSSENFIDQNFSPLYRGFIDISDTR